MNLRPPRAGTPVKRGTSRDYYIGNDGEQVEDEHPIIEGWYPR